MIKKITLFTMLLYASMAFAQPANDNPTGATALTVGVDFASNSITATNVAATNSEDTDSSIPAPDCGGYDGMDVWFSAVVPDSGTLIFETAQDNSQPNFNDTAIAAYSGNTDALVLESCDDESGEESFSQLVLTNLMPGETIYLRVWDFFGGSEGTFQVSAYSPLPPENDEPSNAIALEMGVIFSENVISATNFAATNSEVQDPTLPNPSCGNYQGSDVWFSVVVPESGELIVETAIDNFSEFNPFEGINLAAYSGNIGDLTELVCVASNKDDDFSRLDITSRTSGELLYIRAWNFGNRVQDRFLISALQRPLKPENDEPENATSLTLGNSFMSNAIISTNLGATASEEQDATIPDPNCGDYQGEDVWFEVAVPNSGVISLEVQDTNGRTRFNNLAIGVYSGQIGALQLEGCSELFTTRVDLTERTPGEVLQLRVWFDSGDDRGEFQVSAFEPIPPVNDEPLDAIELIVGANTIDNVLASNHREATASELNDSSIPTPDCGDYQGGDVWFSAVVPASGNIAFDINDNSIDSMNLATAVYSGGIGALELVECQASTFGGVTTITLEGRTVGELLYVRVWTENNTIRGDFNISAFDNMPPVNDDLSGAIELVVGDNFNENNVISSGQDATDSELTDASIPNPTCGGYQGGDIWFSATVPNSGSLSIEVRRGSINNFNDYAIAAYVGDIGMLSQVACATSFFSFNNARMDLINRTPGEVIYIRAWSIGVSERAFVYDISAFEVTAPVNNTPDAAIVLSVGSKFSSNAIDGTNEGATASEEVNTTIPNPSCGNYEGRDVWFSAEVPSSGSIILETRSAGSNSILFGTAITAYTGTLTSLREVGCSFNGGRNNFALLELSGLTSGEIVYFRVWDFSGSPGEFQISSWSPFTLSQSNIDEEDTLSFFPNPVQNILNIKMKKAAKEVILYTSEGKKIKTFQNSANTLSLDMKDLSTGLYFVKLVSDKSIKTLKVFKK